MHKKNKQCRLAVKRIKSGSGEVSSQDREFALKECNYKEQPEEVPKYAKINTENPEKKKSLRTTGNRAKLDNLRKIARGFPVKNGASGGEVKQVGGPMSQLQKFQMKRKRN